jgi:hypothetical protein
MKLGNNQEINLDKLKNIQDQFNNSIKILEKNIAESITNKQKIENLKKDLFEASEKFVQAEKYLQDLKIKLKNMTT